MPIEKVKVEEKLTQINSSLDLLLYQHIYTYTRTHTEHNSLAQLNIDDACLFARKFRNIRNSTDVSLSFLRYVSLDLAMLALRWSYVCAPISIH